MEKCLLVSVLLSMIFSIGSCLRCYECRSDDVPNCGDPFNLVGVTAIECDNFFTQSTFTCFKAVHFAAGQYITTRGCAPFSVETFPVALQRAMAGTYWKRGNSISLCDYDVCNNSRKFQMPGILLLFLLAFGRFLAWRTWRNGFKAVTILCWTRPGKTVTRLDSFGKVIFFSENRNVIANVMFIISSGILYLLKMHA